MLAGKHPPYGGVYTNPARAALKSARDLPRNSGTGQETSLELRFPLPSLETEIGELQ